MAVNLNPAFKYRLDPLSVRSDRFRRRKSQTQTRRIKRRLKVKPRHVLISFLALAAFFVAFQQTWLFMISWEELTIKNIEIISQRPDLKLAAENILSGHRLGNLLLADIDLLRDGLEAHRWIKKARVRKVFPSTLHIEIQERVPAAILKRKTLEMIDREGILLDPVAWDARAGLPIFIDSRGFRTDAEEKLSRAWRCLDELTPDQLQMVDSLDLSEYRNVVMTLKDSEIRLKLGDEDFSERLLTWLEDRAALSKRYGPIEYADLRFQGRTYLGLKKGPAAKAAGDPGKEAP